MLRLLCLVWGLFFAGYSLTILGLVHQGQEDVTREIGGSIHFVEQAIIAAERDEKVLDMLLAGNTRHFRFYLGGPELDRDNMRSGSDVPVFFQQLLQPQEAFLQRPWQYPLAGGRVLYVVAAPEDEIEEVWESALMISLLFVAASTLSSALLVWAVKQRLKPIGRLVSQLDKAPAMLTAKMHDYQTPEAAKLVAHFSRITGALEQAEDGNRQLTQRLMTLQEEERTRLARALHDDLGQYVSGIQAQAFVVSHSVEKPEIVASAAKTITVNCEAMQQSFRALLKDLHPVALNQLGFDAAVKGLVEQWQLMSSIDVALEIEEPLPSFSIEEQTNLYRIIQEALHNVYRHAEATRVRVSLTAQDALQVIVSDNGKGFSAGALPNIGVMSMHERANQLGGQLTLESTNGSGTQVCFTRELL
ncbi:MAG: sensor histidine kinase [Pontibacterium sp.]